MGSKDDWKAQIKQVIDQPTGPGGESLLLGTIEEFVAMLNENRWIHAELDQGSTVSLRSVVLTPKLRRNERNVILSLWVTPYSVSIVGEQGREFDDTRTLQQFFVDFAKRSELLATTEKYRKLCLLPIRGTLRMSYSLPYDREDVTVIVDPAEQEKLVEMTDCGSPSVITVKVALAPLGNRTGEQVEYRFLDSAGFGLSLTEEPRPAEDGSLYLTGTTFLVSAGTPPFNLAANTKRWFRGSIVGGVGFLLTFDEAEELIQKDPKNKDVLFPYLSGEDLNTRPDQSPSRFAINFRSWPLSRDDAPDGYKGPLASDFPEALARVESTVKPVRAAMRATSSGPWWQFRRRSESLDLAVQGMSRMLALTEVGKYITLAFVRPELIVSHHAVVFPSEEASLFALLQSCAHTEWANQLGSFMHTYGRYVPVDCFETFPFPASSGELGDVGERYHCHRQSVMMGRGEGLTKTYNRFHDQNERDDDIAALRQLHVDMDEAVVRAYGWSDLALEHDFYGTTQGRRYAACDRARRELFDRLLHLNRERYADEVAQGRHDVKEGTRTARSKALIHTRRGRVYAQRASDPKPAAGTAVRERSEMHTMIEGARELPVAHLSVRVPWHDAGWDGTVCRKPRENTACLILKNIAEKKNDTAEDRCAGCSWDKLEPAKLPACVGERGSVMAPFEHTRFMEHPYAKTSKTHEHFAQTPLHQPPYSAACIPFGWMLKGAAEDGENGTEGIVAKLQLGYHAEREPELGFKNNFVQERTNQLVLLDTFFSAVRPKETLCFLYAKRTPLAEDSRRVIVGVGRVLSVGAPVEYQYTTPKPPLRAMLWERNVVHSIRPGFEDGFLFPYQEILALAEKDGSINPADFVAFAPEDHFAEFSYVTAHVSHGAAIASLLSCAAVLHKIGERVPGPWDAVLVWIDRELNRLWKMRGPFPGFGSALTAFGLPHGSLIAYDIALAQAKAGSAWNEDPWPLFEKILQDPSTLSDGLAKELGPSYQKMWAKLGAERKALLKLLARFELGEAQATRFYQETERKKAGIEVKDTQILANPYLLYELDRTQVDAVQLATIDRGMYPDPIVRDKHPVPPPSALDDAVDPRRVRAFVIDELEKCAALGHTLRPRDWVIQAVRDRDVKPGCPLGVDVLAVADEHFAPVVHRTRMGDGGEAYQLEHLVTTGALIRDAVEKRLKGKRHANSHSWRTLLDAALPPFSEATDPEQEERARQEKVAALAEIFASRFSVLIGSAGTGKTTLLKVLCDIPEVSTSGILLLAPTGKARVRLEAQTHREGKTIAQFLLGLGRYQGDTGRYFVSGSEKKAADYRTVIIDECSMLTEEQLAAVLDALGGVQRLILVGDPRQLPPIGAGRPFLDVARRLAPANVDGIFPKHGPGYAELTIPRRQRGAARDDLLLAQWFSGRPTGAGADEVWDRIESGTTDNLRLIPWGTPEELEERLMVELASELGLAGPDDQNGFEESIGGERFGEAVYFSNKWGDKKGAAAKAEDWQILSPVRAGLHGVESLNRAIQTRFRRRALDWAETAQPWTRKILKPLGPQRIVYGDKVISVRNGRRYDVWPNPEEKPYIANGDMGVVVGQYKGIKSKLKSVSKLEVEFLSQAGRKVGYWPTDFGEEGEAPLELAYALTVHKTQGSEFKTTFVVLPNPCWLLSRELLYTALTRQKDRIVIFHQGSIREFRRFSAGHESETARRMTNLFEAPRPVQVRAGDAKEARFFEEGLIHRSERGELMRSKSEIIIANMLFSKGIKGYHYERELAAGGSKRYPDFTIEDDESGITYYWEHLGMLYDPAYRKRWEAKLAWYRGVGIIPLAEGGGENGTLILTQDDEHGGLDTAAVAKIIEEVLKP